MTRHIPIIIATTTGLFHEYPPRKNAIIPKIIINTEDTVEKFLSENIPTIPISTSKIPIIYNCNPKMNDNASILNMNNKPNIIAKTPKIAFTAVNSVSIDIIPKNSKLTPIRMDTIPEVIKGQTIKNNPKIIANIPDI